MPEPDDGALEPFASWQEQTAAVEAMARAAGLDADEPAVRRCPQCSTLTGQSGVCPTCGWWPR